VKEGAGTAFQEISSSKCCGHGFFSAFACAPSMPVLSGRFRDGLQTELETKGLSHCKRRDGALAFASLW